MLALLKLTWLEVKIFVREPMGFIGTVLVPVALFAGIGRMVGPEMRRGAPRLPPAISVDLPILTSILIALSAVLSLMAIMAIYREGGILKRLRATPLRPYTILTAHVLVKLLFTAVTLVLMFMAGRRYYPIEPGVPLTSFTFGVLYSSIAILALGFPLASVVPTARFAQPIGAIVLYPMLALSGLFFPIGALPPSVQAVARVLPFTYAVSLLRGLWRGDAWSAHALDVTALALITVLCVAISSRAFRWE